MNSTTAGSAAPADLAAAEIVDHAILSRRSVRGFLSQTVPRETVEHLLRVASRAPSGSNIQPWRAYVLSGDALTALTDALTAQHDAGVPTTPEYDYYPREWRSPYLDRRRKAGWGLYQLAGVARGDREAAHQQRARNFSFFGAPVGMVFTLDPTLGKGGWLDTGMFLQNLMVAARGRGLDTCPQVSIAGYPAVVREHLKLPATELVLCGLALGWADPDEPTNALLTEREDLSTFVTFMADRDIHPTRIP
ncbi:MAG: nitroreductase [Variovorax sp.]